MLRAAIFVVLGALAFGSLGLAADTQPRSLTLDDVKRMVSVSSPAFSPDGKSIVVVVSRMDYGHDRYRSELDVVSIASGERRALTFERTELGAPRFSPDGSRLAFVAGDDRHHGQVWVMPMSGGDAVRITSAPEGVEQYSWRPDGAAIAYVAADAAPKKTGDVAQNQDLITLGNDDLFVQSEPMPSHIWLVPSTGGNPRRLTRGAWSLPVAYPPGPPSAPISWSPDGKSILYTRLPNPHDGDAYLSTLWALDVAGGVSRKLTQHDKFESFGTFAPKGDHYSYLYPRDGDPNNEFEVTVASNGGEKVVTRDLDRNFFRALWMPDGTSLLVGGNDTERASLWIQPLDGPAKKLDLGDASPRTGFWLDADVGPDGAVAFVGTTPSRPQELYYVAGIDAKVRRLTDFNAATEQLALAKPQMLTGTSDGFSDNGVLWSPPDASPGTKLPLVLIIHGGPTSASLLTFDTFAQVIASRGYRVFEPNYRGSDHLGNAYMRAIFNDAGAGPGRDVAAGLATVRALGGVDAAKIAVTGWSYGGYMTSWMIGHYGGWRAAISGAAVNNLFDEYNLADGNVSNRFGFANFVSPYRSEAALRLYLAQSPISYARNVHTPTLILTDLRDARVPPTQSFEMYHALQTNGTHVEFKAWPIAGHNPTDPVRSLQRLSVWTQWLDRWLR